MKQIRVNLGEELAVSACFCHVDGLYAGFNPNGEGNCVADLTDGP